ncbi:chloride channel CLIC-like protein 1 isoform X1 [Alligator mississippiensis]|uniref:Chloride channel CLIC-like protein 1 n=2 Tax=Alligator mississippiensis TaxID=8496 RepID=A0A151M434_ALLMI|nr:chloride channel CLIC-like protein 1 isoform X1 [Alligator mississippiensis]XP_014457553.1 chloride channel CLIC-like protein 1 isoform X1 [Alligator mississippiensis]XP_014457554.1 chloride channel CLIC-like protein 1 isoform X1 [Alligator mississippiensis]KYO19258.1 chloride channel CLIC-like protein 1 [Alligator mississippiensis]
MHLSLVLCTALLIGSGSAQDDDWIDPTDMLNYDAASVSMRRPNKVNDDESETEKTVNADESTASQEDLQGCQRTVESLMQQIEDYKKKEKTNSYESSSIHIFRRYLNKILNEIRKLGFPNENTGSMHYDSEIVLTKQTLSEIERFLNEEDLQPAALDDALNDMQTNFKHHDYEAWKWRFEDAFGVCPYDIFMGLLCLVCIVVIIATELWTRISWLTQIKRVFLICFLISFGWNWVYLYKVAFAQHQAEVVKMEKFDNVCAEKISWSGNLFEWFRSSWTFQDDHCQKYYELILVNPIWLVPPTKALAVTFTNFVTEPLKHIGQGIGEFIKGLMKEIPLLLQVPVLIIMALAFLGFCYGAGRSVNLFRALTSSEREPQSSLPPSDRPKEEPKEYVQYICAGDSNIRHRMNAGHIDVRTYERGDGLRDGEGHMRPQNGKKNSEVLQAGDMPDAQIEEHTKMATSNGSHASSEEQAVCSVKRSKDQSHEGEIAPEQQKLCTPGDLQESEAKCGTEPNCSPEENNANVQDC